MWSLSASPVETVVTAREEMIAGSAVTAIADPVVTETAESADPAGSTGMETVPAASTAPRWRLPLLKSTISKSPQKRSSSNRIILKTDISPRAHQSLAKAPGGIYLF